MGIIGEKLKEQIKKEKKQHFSDTTATILEFNNTTGRAIIRYNNPNGEGTIRRENVPVASSLGGVTGSAFRTGQKCSITFLGENLYAPLITGIISNYYQEKTCSDQGAYLIDTNILDTEKPDTISPMVNDWIDEKNQNLYKYKNDYTDAVDLDVVEIVYDLIRNLDKYSNKEQGITNLDTKATIRLKENGDIDSFIDNNIGIRFSHSNRSIEFYGNHILLNGIQLDLNKFIELFRKE